MRRLEVQRALSGGKLLSPQEIEPGIIPPRHVVLIPDGNRRWAMARGLPPIEGHRRGAAALEELIKASRDWGIPVLTVWGLSTENVEKRSSEEIAALMGIFESFLTDERRIGELLQANVKVRCIGRRDRIAKLKPSLLEAIKGIEKRTKGQGQTLILALDYGGRDELVRTFRDIAQGIKEGVLQPDDIDENLISLHLDTAGLPDPDLIIRTSGERRTSGMFTFQGALAELYFYDSTVNFPDLTPELLREALLDFGKRQRRFGR